MVQRQFAAFDNEAFDVDPSSTSLTVGSPIINNSSTPVGTTFNFTGGFEYLSIILEDTSSQPDQTGPTITVTVFSQNGQTSNIWAMASDTELQTGVR
jgi:hypothetical protein